MARPLISPLVSNSDYFGRLEGVSRFYARHPTNTIPAQNFMTAAGGVLFLPTTSGDVYTVVDKIILQGYQPAPNAQFDRAQIHLDVYDAVAELVTTFSFQSGNYFFNNASDPDIQLAGQVRLEWDTKGTLVLPPGHSVVARVSSATLLKMVPFMTGYRIPGETARSLNLNAYSFAGQIPASTTNTVMVAGRSGAHTRIKNIRVTGAGGGIATNYRVRLSFGDGSTFHPIITFYCNGTQPWHWPNFNLTNLHITGPEGYGVYAQVLPNNSQTPIAVNITTEFVKNAETQLTTGSYPTSAATGQETGGRFFWCHLQGADLPTLYTAAYLTRDGTSLASQPFLIDGCYMQMQGTGSPATGASYMGVNAGNAALVDLGGGIIIPNTTINALPSMVSWDQSGYYEHALLYNDLGGLPMFQPNPVISLGGAASSLTVWGRIANLNSSVPGLGTGAGLFFGSNPTSD